MALNRFSAWRWKYEVNVSVPDSAAGQKARLMLYWRPGMRADFRDVRFTDKNGNVLPYLLQYGITYSFARFFVTLPANDNTIFLHYGQGGVRTGSSLSEIGGIFFDDLETGIISSTKWDTKITSGPAGACGTIEIKTDNVYGSYSLGIEMERGTFYSSGYDHIHALMKIPLTSIPVGTIFYMGCHAVRWITSEYGADFLGFGTGADSSDGHLYALPIDSTWRFYLIRVYRSAAGTWEYIIWKDGTQVYTGTKTQTYSTNYLFGIQGSEFGHAINDYIRIDNILAYTVPTTAPTTYINIPSLGQRCLTQFRKTPLFTSITASTAAKLTPALAGYQDSMTFESPVIQLGPSGFAFGLPDAITENAGLTLHASEPVFVDFAGLDDFSLVSATIKKSITDAYWSFSGAFAGDLVPKSGSRIKFNAKDPDGASHLIFYGKSTSTRPSFGYLGTSVQMDGADDCQGLAIQKIPWDARILKLDDIYYPGWELWISYLANLTGNNLVARTINRPSAGSIEISLDPKATRLEAIKKICEYTGYLFFSKIINTGTTEAPIWKTGLYFLDPADLDNPVGGLDLPAPLTLTAPDSSLLDAPSLEPDLENNYNLVTVYGTYSSDGVFYVMSACTPEVAAGRETAREYRYEDNKIYEKGSTFQNEAVKWLIYFLTRQASVKMKFIDRFDLELYQRVKFGAGYSATLQGLTARPAFTSVRVYDPRDSINFQDIDISGVPRPSWLRITDISYGCSQLSNTVEITAKTDWIYSNSDPYIDPAYSQYIGSGYFKPEISDSTSTTQSMIDNSLNKQAAAQKGTVLSISTDLKTAEVLTEDGKTITAAVVSTVAAGSSVLVIPGSAGYYISG